MSQEETQPTNVDPSGDSIGSGDSSVLRNSDHAEPASSSQVPETQKKGKGKKPTNPARSAAAKKAAAARKAKDEKLNALEKRLSFFEDIYKQAEAEVGAAGAEEPQEETGAEDQSEPQASSSARPGDPGYNPGVGELDETEAVLDQGAGGGAMDLSGGGNPPPATPQRKRYTARRAGGAFNRRIYGKLDASQGTVVSARGKVGGRKQLSHQFRKIHRGMSDEELSRFAIGSIRQNQYA